LTVIREIEGNGLIISLEHRPFSIVKFMPPAFEDKNFLVTICEDTIIPHLPDRQRIPIAVQRANRDLTAGMVLYRKFFDSWSEAEEDYIERVRIRLGISLERAKRGRTLPEDFKFKKS